MDSLKRHIEGKKFPRDYSQEQIRRIRETTRELLKKAGLKEVTNG